jgi:hypothetical protein
MRRATLSNTVRNKKRTVCITENTRNRAVLLRTRFTKLWRSEININLKIETQKRRRRRFCVRRTIYHVYQGQ